jgi:hypothetical protein
MCISYRNSEAGCHSVQVVGVVAHGHYLGNDCLAGPLHSEYFRQLLKVVSSSLSNGEDSVAQPAHAQVAQLLVEELDAELAGQEWNVFNDSEAHSPLLVLSQLDNGREQGLGEQIDADDCEKNG